MRVAKCLAVLAILIMGESGLFGCGGGGGVPDLDPPFIAAVTPLSGQTGQQVTFRATTQNGPVTSWTWSFGGGASPNTSTQAMPTVTLGDPGVYSCRVEAGNAAHIITATFGLVVEP